MLPCSELHVEGFASLRCLTRLCLHSFAGVFYSLPLDLIGYVIEPIVPHEQLCHVRLDILPVVCIALVEVLNTLVVYIAIGPKPLVPNHVPLFRVGIDADPL